MKSSKKEMDPIIIAVSTAWVVEQAGIYDTRGLPKEIDLLRVTELSSLGLTEQQIAECLGISLSTLNRQSKFRHHRHNLRYQKK